MTHELTDNAVATVQQMPADLAVMKLENDSIMSLAAARPRSMAQIREQVVEQLAEFPETAGDMIYEKPVGQDPNTGEMKYARGLSITAAEMLAEVYGFNRVRVDVTPIDADTVRVEATFVDYQRGRMWQDAGIVSRLFKRRNGKVDRHPEDRFHGVVVKAEASRRIREVILRSVPPGLRAEVYRLAEEQAATVLTPAKAKQIIDKFGTLGVTPEQIERVVGRSMKAGWREEDRRRLLGVWNAIQASETTVVDVFGPPATRDDADPNAHEAAEEGEQATDPSTASAGETPARATDYEQALELLRQAETAEDLDSIVQAIEACAFDGTISDKEAATLRGMVTKKRASIGGSEEPEGDK